jgi:hypothetical protein
MTIRRDNDPAGPSILGERKNIQVAPLADSD